MFGYPKEDLRNLSPGLEPPWGPVLPGFKPNTWNPGHMISPKSWRGASGDGPALAPAAGSPARDGGTTSLTGARFLKRGRRKKANFRVDGGISRPLFSTQSFVQAFLPGVVCKEGSLEIIRNLAACLGNLEHCEVCSGTQTGMSLLDTWWLDKQTNGKV